MTHHTLTTPVTEGEVRALQVGDQVTLEGTLFGIRDATLIHMFGEKDEAACAFAFAFGFANAGTGR